MIQFTKNDFVVPAYITTPIRDDYFSQYNIQHFDNDGFQLNRLEQMYYDAHGIRIEECLGVQAAHYTWATVNHKNYILDHSMILTRCGYAGQALEQLKEHSKEFPYLRKYLTTKPKWGLDFALEYFDEDSYIEVIHIEQDYNTYEQAKQAKAEFERRILSTNWISFTQHIITKRTEWEKLQGMARNDWKAREWGLKKAETTLKAF
jgi:hypothetical protein